MIKDGISVYYSYLPSTRFMHAGRLVGHNGAVCTLTVRGNLTATGSRDRFIKIGYGIPPTYMHYCMKRITVNVHL